MWGNVARVSVQILHHHESIKIQDFSGSGLMDNGASGDSLLGGGRGSILISSCLTLLLKLLLELLFLKMRLKQRTSSFLDACNELWTDIC